MIAVRCSFLLPLALLVWSKCDAACYFPTELQGEFVMQSTVSAGSQVQYSKVNITEVSIPIWGHCHRRIGNNVILMDTSGGGNCIRCFHLNLRSKNVLQVRTEGLDKCYTREEAAVATCPGEHALPKMPHMLKEILLYKTNELGGDDIRKEFCPINGHFTFTYNLNEGSENKPECPDPVSELDNCPSASGLNLHFRRCSFENHDITFQCLGHWAGPGPGRERYLALRDTRVGAERRAQYRCALYQQDDATGNIYMAFSSDSTCTSDLRSSTDGFETLVLNSVSGARWPPMVEASACRFPSWSQGDWEHVDIDGNTFIYKDHANFKTSTIKCISSDNGREEERFLIFSRNQCGEEQYNCIWIKRRDMNVLEFQIGTYSSEYYNSSLCSDANFQQNAWITQGKTDVIKESPCPIAGEYTGMVPDDTGLCAKLYSDCNNPEIMFYTVSDCSDQSQVYEEREYRCLGQWEEDGLMYTYTQRRDVGNSYECFVGSIKPSNEIFIKEAGEHCQRRMSPLHLGMKLTKRGEVGSCFGTQATVSPSRLPPSRPRPTTSWYSSKRPPEPTKPWRPITGPPRGQIESSASILQATFVAVLMSASLIWTMGNI